MAYTIAYFKTGSLSHTDHWTGTLEEARDVACAAISSGAADVVEIRDEQDRLLGHYPRQANA